MDVRLLPHQLLQQSRQLLHMLKQGVALPQAQLAGTHLQQAAEIHPRLPVKEGNRGGVVAGVQPQDRHHVSSSGAFFSGLGGVSSNSVRTKVPKMPLTKDTTSAGSYRLAISTASLMAAALGISGM